MPEETPELLLRTEDPPQIVLQSPVVPAVQVQSPVPASVTVGAPGTPSLGVQEPGRPSLTVWGPQPGPMGPRGVSGQRGLMSRSLTVEGPKHNENLILLVAPEALALNQIVAVFRGSGSLTFSIWHGQSLTSGSAILSDRLLTEDSPLWLTFNPAHEIGSGDYVWLTTSDQTPIATQLFVNLDLEGA